jgi:hypothetical protein
VQVAFARNQQTHLYLGCGFFSKQSGSFWLAHDRSVPSGTRFAVVSGKQMFHQIIDLFVLAACKFAVLIE